AKGIDPKRLVELKQRQEQLKTDIKATESRQDELTQWQRFMQLDWQQLRPQLLSKETELKQQQRELSQLLSQLKADFAASQKRLDEQKRQWQEKMQQADVWLSQLKPLLLKLAELHLAEVTPAVLTASADLVERLARSNE